MGITEEWIKQVCERESENPDLASYIASVHDRLKSEGYEKFDLIEFGGETTGKYIQMIGIDKEDKKKILAMTEEPVESTILGKQFIKRLC